MSKPRKTWPNRIKVSNDVRACMAKVLNPKKKDRKGYNLNMFPNKRPPEGLWIRESKSWNKKLNEIAKELNTKGYSTVRVHPRDAKNTHTDTLRVTSKLFRHKIP